MQEELAQSVGTRAGRAARKVRDAAEEAWERAFEAAQARQGGRAPHGEVDLARWYKTLEVEPGADLETVRKAYRRLMHRYHPDRYAGDPAKYEAATQVATRITAAYNGLRRVLEG
jgi:DnaJ-class molecular chaperone